MAGAAGLSHEGGRGGTGIVGVVTGFASICVNGGEVEYQPETPVQRDGAQAPLSDLAVGQWVALQASGQGEQLQARRIVVLDAAVGPLSSVDAAGGRFVVMGQRAVALEAADLAGLQAGDWVRVSGQRFASGEIRASRVQAWRAGQAQVTGPLRRAPDGTQRVGETPVVSRDPALLVGADDGAEVAVRGEWSDGRLIASELQRQPTRSAVGAVREVLLQGYVHALNGQELQLGYGPLTLSDATRAQLTRAESGRQAMALLLSEVMGVQLPPAPNIGPPRLPSGHWRNYREVMGAAIDLLTPVAVRLGYPEE